MLWQRGFRHHRDNSNKLPYIQFFQAMPTLFDPKQYSEHDQRAQLCEY